MARLKAGEWFLWLDQYPAMLVTSRRDFEGELHFTFFINGNFCNRWRDPETLNACPRLKRQRWVAFPSAKRSDGHTFRAFHTPNGRNARIVAGCRSLTVAEARVHWNGSYPYHISFGTRPSLNAWSLAYVEKVAAHLRKVRG